MEPRCAVTRSARQVLLVLALGAVLSGCLGASTPSPTLPPGVLQLPTLDHEEEWCAGVGLGGMVLTGSPTDPRVAWLASLDGTGRQEIVWQPGYTARFSPNLQVLDPSGRVVFREGDRIKGACVLGPDDPLLIVPGV